MPRRPKITARQVRLISKKIALKEPVEKIKNALKISLSTINRVRADYRALTYEAALECLEHGEYLTDPEYKQALIKERGVSKQWRSAIIQGIVDAKLKATDILDNPPNDPRLAFAPQIVDPQHNPSTLLGEINRRGSASR